MKIGGINSQSSRLILFLFCFISFICTFVLELILNMINYNKCNICCKNKEKERKNKTKLRRWNDNFRKRRSNTSKF